MPSCELVSERATAFMFVRVSKLIQIPIYEVNLRVKRICHRQQEKMCRVSLRLDANDNQLTANELVSLGKRVAYGNGSKVM